MIVAPEGEKEIGAWVCAGCIYIKSKKLAVRVHYSAVAHDLQSKKHNTTSGHIRLFFAMINDVDPLLSDEIELARGLSQNGIAISPGKVVRDVLSLE